MQAILLAAGYGERLLPLTKEFPKPLFPVLNMPVIEYIIRYCSSYDIKNFRINTHHLAQKVEDTVKGFVPPDVKIEFYRESRLLGTGGGIKQMLDDFQDDLALVSNSDVIYNFDFKEALKAHAKSKCPVTLILIPYGEKTGYSKIELDADGTVVDFNSNKAAKRNPGFGIFTGVQIISPKKIPSLPKRETFCIVGDYLRPLLKSGFKINTYFERGLWFDIGDAPKYHASNVQILNNLSRFKILREYLDRCFAKKPNHTYISPDARLDGSAAYSTHVVIGKNVTVGKKAMLGNQTFVCDGCRIADNSSIEKSVLLPGSRIKAGQNLSGMIISEGTDAKINNI